MKTWIKILLLILAIFPIWLTIAAFCDQASPADQLKDVLNERLLSFKERKIQVVEFVPALKNFDTTLLRKNFEIDLTEVHNQAVAPLILEFKDPEGRLEKLFKVTAKLFIQDQVPVATHPLVRGAMLTANDFQMEWKDSGGVRALPASPRNLIGRVVGVSISDDEVIYEPQLQQENLVNKGDRVKVSVVGNGITLSGIGIAEEAGSRGQSIKILNIDSRKEIVATVTESKSVEVHI